MRCRVEGGIWEIFIPGVGLNAHYKFEMIGGNGALFNKSDPFAFFSQHGPQTASLTWDYTRYRWSDDVWMSRRAKRDLYHSPMSIYEVHARLMEAVRGQGRTLADLSANWRTS